MAEIVSILQSVKLKHGSAHRQLVDTSGSNSDGHSDDAGNCTDALRLHPLIQKHAAFHYTHSHNVGYKVDAFTADTSGLGIIHNAAPTRCIESLSEVEWAIKALTNLIQVRTGIF